MKTMKAMAVVAVCLFTLLMAPSGVAQVTLNPLFVVVVGQNSSPYQGEDFLGGGEFAQQFGLSSGAYISEADLGVSGGVGCTFTMTITSGLAPNGGLGDNMVTKERNGDLRAGG